MSEKIGAIYDGIRALLNDQQNSLFNNSTLAEYFTLAMTTLRMKCEENQIPFCLFTTDTPFLITTGMKDIGGPTGPALPGNLVEVLECWETTANTNNDYMQMRHMRFLPKNQVLTSYLEVWSWQNQYIHFLGANNNIQVKLDYLADNFADSTDANQVVRITNSINFLKFYTAALVARFVGENESRTEALANLAQDSIDTMINIKIMSQQNMTTRRRPFMADYKRRAGIYGR